MDRQLLLVSWVGRSGARCMNGSSAWGIILVRAVTIYQLDMIKFDISVGCPCGHAGRKLEFVARECNIGILRFF